MDVLTTVPILWGHTHAAVEVGTNWLPMDALVKVLYSRKIWRGIKFGGLAVYNYYNRQIKIRQNFLLTYIRVPILYQTAKFKSTNILAIAILGSTAKFNISGYTVS